MATARYQQVDHTVERNETGKDLTNVQIQLASCYRERTPCGPILIITPMEGTAWPEY